MESLQFEWDERKNRSNPRKRGIGFEEARTVFYDEHAVQFSDPDHSEEEERFILLGLSLKPRVVVVCHCHRASEMVIRLISARKANKAEEGEYWRRRS